MRMIIFGLMLAVLTACGERAPDKSAQKSKVAENSKPSLAPNPGGFFQPAEQLTLGVSYDQMASKFERFLFLQSVSALPDKTPTHLFKGVNSAMLMNLIGEKSNLTRISYAIPSRYNAEADAMLDLNIIHLGIQTVAPDCKDCLAWMGAAIDGSGSDMKIVGNIRIFHEDLKVAHVFIISDKNSPMNIGENPK